VAVYTNVSPAELSVFLKLYDQGSLKQITPIAEGVENTNYRIDTDHGRFILTLFEKRVSVDDLPFFMALKAHLAGQGLPAPTPIKTRTGEIIGRLNHRPAVLVEFLDGRPVMAPDAKACSALGDKLARLHRAVSGFGDKRQNPLSLEGWRTLAEKCAGAERIEKGLTKKITNELSHLESTWPKGLPEGVIHADLFADNVLFQDNTITGLIDFYFACTGFFAYDLAICINAWCFDAQSEFQPENAAALLHAYLQHRPLNEHERRALPVLLRGAAMRFLLTRAYDWLNQEPGALVSVKDPLDYGRILAFHQNDGGRVFEDLLTDIHMRTGE